MKLGEKLQQLRRQSGLSQEQLAARLTVSRQAVSKWELDETMPDTDNVVQLSRIFGVSCDYLLREEVEERDASPAVQEPAQPAQSPPQPAAPGETHLTEQGWIHNAFVLSLGLCAVGLAVAFIFYRINGHTVRPLVIGFIIQLLGIVLFELSTPRMGSGRISARMSFYMTACWLVFPNLVCLILGWGFEHFGWTVSPLRAVTYWFVLYLLLCLAVTAVLLVLRRQRAKT